MWVKTKINALINMTLGDKEWLFDASAAVLRAKKAPKTIRYDDVRVGEPI
jgi:hypothetical protein